MLSVARQEHEIVRDGRGGDRDIRKAWMPTGGGGTVGQATGDPACSGVEGQDALIAVLDQSVQPWTAAGIGYVSMN